VPLLFLGKTNTIVVSNNLGERWFGLHPYSHQWALNLGQRFKTGARKEVDVFIKFQLTTCHLTPSTMSLSAIAKLYDCPLLMLHDCQKVAYARMSDFCFKSQGYGSLCIFGTAIWF